jgi:hypothetical protein
VDAHRIRVVRQGSYLGTEVDGKWWRRYRGTGFFARGNGELWTDEAGLHFRKALTRAPLSIAWDEMTAVRLGKWHCGRSGHGRPLLKVDFGRDGKSLTAGFDLGGDRQEMEQFAEELRGELSSRS